MLSQQTTSFSPAELAYLQSSLSLIPPLRPDARSATTFRPLIAETDLLPSTNGSARLCFADGTEGIVGVKAEVERSGRHGSNQRASNDAEDVVEDDVLEATLSHAGRVGDSRWVEVCIDMPGQRDDDSMATSLAQMIHEGLVTDGTLSSRLYINHNWHWKLCIDILLLSPPASYPVPLLSISTHLALLTTRLPALVSQGEEDPFFNDDWEAAIPLYPRSNSKHRVGAPKHVPKPPVSIMTISVGPNLFFDPSREELAVADAVMVVTVASTYGSSGAKVLTIRTLDPPAGVTGSSSAALAGEPEFGKKEEGEGVWNPKRGGIKRDVIARMVNLCSKEGGVAEEVLTTLEGFV